MKIVSISNQKGGCGKTTTTINLAGALASLGKRVLVIDLDPQAHATFGLGVTNQAVDSSIYNVLTGHVEKQRAIGDCIIAVSDNLDIIPSNILLSTLEQEMSDKEDAVSKLHCMIQQGQLAYDYLFIDCPPSLGFLTFNALRAAELVIVPIDMSAFSLMGVGKLLGMLELIKVKIAHAPRVKALATIFDRRTKYSQTMLNEIKAFFRDQMLETTIRCSVALKKAAFAGVPVVRLEIDSNGALDHIALARELLKLDGAVEFEKALEEVENDQIANIALTPRETDTIPQDTSIQAQETAAAPANRISEIAGLAPESIPATADQRIATMTVQAHKDILFLLNMPAARDVHVVGEFNHWKINDDSRLDRHDNGVWEKRLQLNSGTYRYKFVIDGEWTLDSANGAREPNPFGSYDSILQI